MAIVSNGARLEWHNGGRDVSVAEIALRNGVTLTGKVDGELDPTSRNVVGTGIVRYTW